METLFWVFKETLLSYVFRQFYYNVNNGAMQVYYIQVNKMLNRLYSFVTKSQQFRRICAISREGYSRSIPLQELFRGY